MTTPNSSAPTVDINSDPSTFEGSGIDLEARETRDLPLTHESQTFRTFQDSGTLRCNVGRTEQTFRLVAGSAMLAAAVFAPMGRGWRVALAAIGAAELITGTTRHCPISEALGIDTCRHSERD